MSRVLIVVCLLFSAGCALNTASPLGSLPISVTYEIQDKQIRLTIDFDGEELTCSCSDDCIKITVLEVHFYEKSRCSVRDLESGDIFSKYPKIDAVLVDNSGELWVSQEQNSVSPVASFVRFYDAGGKCSGSMKYPYSKIRIPINTDGFDCIGLDFEFEDEGVRSQRSLYLFQRGFNMTIARGLRRAL